LARGGKLKLSHDAAQSQGILQEKLKDRASLALEIRS
jgi:hypothetical protein